MFDKAALKVKQKQAELKAFTNATGNPIRLERTQVSGYNRSVAGKVTQAQKFADTINATVTADGISVKATVHLYAQARERGISANAIVDSLTAPLDITSVKYDKGRPSKNYIGEKATTSVNPLNGNATTVHGTHTKLSKKLKGGQT